MLLRNRHDIHLSGITLMTIQEKSLVGNQTGATAGGVWEWNKYKWWGAREVGGALYCVSDLCYY